MIQIYQHPTDENPTLGFTWINYGNMKGCMWDEKYPNKATALHEFNLHKAWLCLSAFEDIRRFYVQFVPKEDRQQQEQEVVDALRASCQVCIDNKENYRLILETIMEKAKFIKILVKSVPKDNFPVMKMMAASLIGFCKAELDEQQKDKSQVETPPGE